MYNLSLLQHLSFRLISNILVVKLFKTKAYINPIKGDVSDSELNAGGGQLDTTSEMNEGMP